MKKGKDYNNKGGAIMSVNIALHILEISEDIVEVTFRGKEFFLKNDVIAVFVKSGYWIVFNEEMIAHSNPIDIMVTGFHETRHAYQQLVFNYGSNGPYYNDVPKERIKV